MKEVRFESIKVVPTKMLRDAVRGRSDILVVIEDMDSPVAPRNRVPTCCRCGTSLPASSPATCVRCRIDLRRRAKNGSSAVAATAARQARRREAAKKTPGQHTVFIRIDSPYLPIEDVL